MLINNNSYTDRLMPDDLPHRYSRTTQALNTARTDDFNLTLEEMIRLRTENTGTDILIARAAQDYSRIKDISGNHDPAFTDEQEENVAEDVLLAGIMRRSSEVMGKSDTLIAATAQDYSRIKDISGNHDPAFTDEQEENVAEDVLLASMMRRSAGVMGKSDTLIARAAQNYSRANDIHGRYDPVLTARSQNGDLA